MLPVASAGKVAKRRGCVRDAPPSRCVIGWLAQLCVLSVWCDWLDSCLNA